MKSEKLQIVKLNLFESKKLNVLVDQVEFNDFIRPVCLPTLDRSYNGHDTVVVGWGKQSEGGDPANVLMEVTVPVITQKKCRRRTKYRPSEITENMMCAGYDEGVLDACQGIFSAAYNAIAYRCDIALKGHDMTINCISKSQFDCPSHYSYK